MIILQVAPTANDVHTQTSIPDQLGFYSLRCVRLINQTLPYARTSISMQAQSLL